MIQGSWITQDFICNKFDELEKKKKQKLLKRTKIYEKRKIKNDKGFIVIGDDDLEIEKTKRNALEQYGRWEMLEVTGSSTPTKIVKTVSILLTKFAC